MGRGGSRPGAGRKNKADVVELNEWKETQVKAKRGRPPKEPTVRMRVPAHMADLIKDFAATQGFKLPLYSSRVQAGMPSPVDDNVADTIDLNTFLVKRPSETFLVYATGDSMINAGIADGDLMIVDSSIKPTNGKIVVAAVDGDITVKYLIQKKGRGYLMPANLAYHEIPINEETGAIILGVVTGSVKQH